MSQHKTQAPDLRAAFQTLLNSYCSLLDSEFEFPGAEPPSLADPCAVEARAVLSATQPAQAAPSVESAIMKLISVCHQDGLNRKESATPESLAALDALRAAIKAQAQQAGEVVAWQYELATYVEGVGIGRGWNQRLTSYKPNVPEGMVRNLRPLTYADTQPAAGADVLDAERYRMVRRGQHWSVINGIGDTLRGDAMDAAIDAAIAASGRQE